MRVCFESSKQNCGCLPEESLTSSRSSKAQATTDGASLGLQRGQRAGAAGPAAVGILSLLGPRGVGRAKRKNPGWFWCLGIHPTQAQLS